MERISVRRRRILPITPFRVLPQRSLRSRLVLGFSSTTISPEANLEHPSLLCPRYDFPSRSQTRLCGQDSVVPQRMVAYAQFRRRGGWEGGLSAKSFWPVEEGLLRCGDLFSSESLRQVLVFPPGDPLIPAVLASRP